MSSTNIEWTDQTWNPVTGCTKHSSGCLHCYAETMANRLKSMKIPKYKNGFSITLHHECLEEPLLWKKPRNIFVCSMSDLFHEDVPFDFVDKVMHIIQKTPQHRYQLLTKRPGRMKDYFESHSTPSNIWVGTTVEDASVKNRIDILKSIKASVHYLSCEPLIGDLGEVDLSGIEWIIVGGESGNNGRPMIPEWVDNLYLQAEKQNVAFFFKQWGTWGEDGIKRNKHANGKSFRGQIIQEMPT